MGKKKRKKTVKKQQQVQDVIMPPAGGLKTLEKTMVSLERLVQDREFGSLDEANAFLRETLKNGEISVPGQSADELAQDLMYDAWEATGHERVALALQALRTSPDCSDAYVLLAEEMAGTLAEEKSLYEQGVAAGERYLGEEAFRNDVGHFWGIIATRPYMRARVGLADCLWFLGENEQAIWHYWELLRLNPNDNQGIRYRLLNALMETGRDEEAIKLCHQYEEDCTAAWLYNWALLVFGQEGASKNAERALRTALDGNCHVPDYLLGDESLPETLPDYVSYGGRDEAAAYVTDAIPLWVRTPGAIHWLHMTITEGQA